MPCLITLTTDFGLDDPFAGVMKGVILGLAPDVQIIDITHNIDPQNLIAGAFILESVAPSFPPGTVHIAVVDPGVGSARRPIAVESGGHTFLAPDNGLLTPFLQPGAAVTVLTEERYFRHPVSATFHGRDVFAPAAAWLARGTELSKMGMTMDHPVRLDIRQPVFMNGVLAGEVIHADRFGNLTTNITRRKLHEHFTQGGAIRLSFGSGGELPFASHYSALAPGECGFLVNSWERVEIFMREGSAKAHFKCGIGQAVRITLEPGP